MMIGSFCNDNQQNAIPLNSPFLKQLVEFGIYHVGLRRIRQDIIHPKQIMLIQTTEKCNEKIQN